MDNSVPMYHLELVRDRSIQYKSLTTIGAAVEILHELLDKSPVEQFLCIYMDSSARLVGVEKVAMGSNESVQVDMKSLFRGAVLASVSRVILAHNHPNDNPTPSQQDIRLTSVAVQAGMILGIEIYDHIIVCPNGKHCSLYDYGMEAIKTKTPFSIFDTAK